MDNPGRRLIILSRDEIEALYGRPRFTHDERTEYFSLSSAEKAALAQLGGPLIIPQDPAQPRPGRFRRRPKAGFQGSGRRERRGGQ